MDTETVKKSVGDRVRELRNQRGWYQQELANRAGVSMQTVSNLETGRYSPQLGKLSKIADALGVPLADLLR